MTDLILRIGALLYQLLVGQISIQVALERLVSGLEPVAVEHERYAIEKIASNGTNTVVHPSYGNAALADKLDAIIAALPDLDDAVLAAIAALPAGSDLEIPTGVENAAAVWQYTTYGAGWFYNEPAYNAWARIQLMLEHLTQMTATRMRTAPLFAYSSFNMMFAGTINPLGGPEPDFADIQAGDTILSWLLRTEPRYDWVYNQYTGLVEAVSIDGLDGSVRCLLTPPEFAALKAAVPNVPPVWPGLANVTLGTPVALADELVVAGPLHGVLVECSTPPPGASSWVLGDQEAYYRWGEVSFVSDHGQVEPFQWLGFGLGVYTPKGMTEAASAIFRVSRLPTATVTPFVIT